MHKQNKIRLSTVDRVMNIFVLTIVGFLLVIILYPLIYVVSCSVSAGSAVSAGRVLFLPVDFSLQGYKLAFSYKTIWSGYRNAIVYTVLYTVLGLGMTILAAYPLSRRNFQGKKIYMAFFLFTMFFSGGMVPAYLLMSNLHLINSPWAVILSGTFSVYNMIVMRTFMQTSIPNELLESAKLDGVSDIGYLVRIVLPLSKAVIAVIVLYYALGMWNSYYDAMIYLRDSDLFPLQLVLRQILNASRINLDQIRDPELIRQLRGSADVMKYAIIVLSSVPLLVFYPFVQKYFEKGVMIGSVKG